jgi:molybdopterin-guanine dinucleotide biosynthesis protein A
MTRAYGLILAGGEGSRLGGARKADLRIGGVRLIERVARQMGDGVEDLRVASGQLTIDGFDCIRDEASAAMGPLAGIRAGLHALQKTASGDDVLVCVAVDTPFLPADYVPRLLSVAAENGAAYAAWGENIYPTNSAWRLSALADALEDASESAGPKAILTRLKALRVDWSAEAPLDPFANLNTLNDQIALQRRALAPGYDRFIHRLQQ